MRQWRRFGVIASAMAILLGAFVVPGVKDVDLSASSSAIGYDDVRLMTATDLYGGSFDPTAHFMLHVSDGALNVGTVTLVWTPEEFRPFASNFLPTAWNTLTLDQSVRVGTQIMIARILSNTDPDLRIVTESQSSIMASQAKVWLLNHPDQAPPANTLTFYTFDSQSRPNGGVASRFTGVTVPVLGITGTGPTPQTQYKTYDFGREYEGFVNFPAYLIDVPAVLNAIIGIGVLHGRIAHVDLDDPTYVKEEVGNTTYVTAPTSFLPLLVPLRTLAAAFGQKDVRVLDALEPVLRVVIDAGYPGNNPLANQGEYIPARFGVPLANVVRMFQQLPAAVHEGLAILHGPSATPPVSSVSSETSEPTVGSENQARNPSLVPSVSRTVASSLTNDENDRGTPSPKLVTNQLPAGSSEQVPVVSKEVSEPIETDLAGQVPREQPSGEPEQVNSEDNASVDMPKSNVTDTKKVTSDSGGTSRSSDSPKPPRKNWHPGDGIKHALDVIHHVTHANAPKASVSAGATSSESHSSGSSTGSSNSSDSGSE